MGSRIQLYEGSAITVPLDDPLDVDKWLISGEAFGKAQRTDLLLYQSRLDVYEREIDGIIGKETVPEVAYERLHEAVARMRRIRDQWRIAKWTATFLAAILVVAANASMAWCQPQ